MMCRGLFVAMLATGVLGVTAGAASAATLTVTTTNDSNDGSCTASLCSLRDAVNAASSGDTIVVPAGTYDISKTLGELVISQSVTIQGAGASSTILDGGGSSGTRIFNVQSGSVTISGVTLQHGNGSLDRGGAALVAPGSTLTLDSDALTGNSAPNQGGAIEDDGTLVVQSSSFTDNKTNGNGGAINVSGPATGPAGGLSVTDSTFSGNAATQTGGAIRLQSGGVALPATINKSTFADNASGSGGGALEDSNTGNSATLSLTDSTITANTAGTVGGGIYIGNGPSADQITNDTIADNTATSGPGGDVGLGGGTSPVFTNTIVSGGSAPSGPDCKGIVTITSNGHNLEDDATSQCNFTASGDLINTNPKLGSLANNGGPTETMALQAGSPAIDAGTNAGCPATDQRGVARPQGSACDIGAYEVAPPSATTGPASGVSPTGATISGTVANPDAQAASVTFKYGTSTGYGSTVAASAAPALSGATAYTAPLSGLKPNTTYHYTVVVTNPDGTSTGADKTFTTPPPPNNFQVKSHKVSKTGKLTIKLVAPWSGVFKGKATFKVKIGKHHKTFTYGTASKSASGAGTVTMTIKLSKKAKAELLALGHATVSVTITFTPTGGSSAHKTFKQKIKVNSKHKFS